MINKRLLIKNLLAHNDECSFYDKKRQLNLHTKEGKAKFLKHICALSNSNPSNNSYIVVGVEDENNEITGDDFFDDSRIQNLVNAFLENPPKIQYENVPFPNLPKDKVVGLTLFNGKIKDSLSLTRIELDDQKNKVWKWEKTLASGTKIVREMSEKDSVLYENSDIAVAVIDRVEGKGKNTKFFTDFYSLDNNIKFNGGSIFRKENKEIKDVLQFDLNAEFQRSFISPDSRISTDFELSLFPDGRIVPSARIGALTDMNKNLEYFWAVKLKYNLIRIKNR